MKTFLKIAVAVMLTAAMVIPSITWASPDQWPKKIRLGLIPTEGGSETKERFEPLVNHLENKLRHRSGSCQCFGLRGNHYRHGA